MTKTLNLKPQNLNIIFMGTPEIGATILEALIKDNYQVDTVITRTDKPRGRSGEPEKSPVKILAEKHGIPLFQPKSKLELEEFVAKKKPDLIVVCAFGMIITKGTLESAKYGAINVHPSLLPKWRGPAPVMAPIFHGEKETGTTIMLMNEKMDEGDILTQTKYQMVGNETTPELLKTLAKLSAKLLLKTVPGYLNGEIKPQKQDDSKATYTPMIKKEDGQVLFNKYEATGIERAARAFTPWPGLFTYWNGKKLDIFDISLSDENIDPGKVMFTNSTLLIGAKRDSIRVGSLKLEGKNKVTATEFVRGYPKFLESGLD